jgi:hypothetical protein
MVVSRTCKALNEQGEPCRAAPLHDSDYCVFHDPEHAAAMKEAQRLGGLRRRKEATLALAYDFEGLTGIPEIRRLLEVAAIDALNLENNLGRIRALGYLAQIAASLLEKGELAERMKAIEAALGPRIVKPEGPKRRRWGFP